MSSEKEEIICRWLKRKFEPIFVKRDAWTKFGQGDDENWQRKKMLFKRKGLPTILVQVVAGGRRERRETQRSIYNPLYKSVEKKTSSPLRRVYPPAAHPIDSVERVRREL